MLLVSSNGWTQSKINKMRTKRQYMENDNYFKSSRMDSLSMKLKKEEKPWGVGLHFSSGTNLSNSHNDRVYTQKLSMSGAYKFDDRFSLGLQSELSYYAQDNNIPKEEGNPKWDDVCLSGNHILGEYQNVKFDHGASIFAPTSYDTQYEGIKTGLGYGLSANHEFYIIRLEHKLSVNYTVHSFEYSPTTRRRNSPWTNSYNFNIGIPYKINQQFLIGLSEKVESRSSFDNDYFLVSSTLVYGSMSWKKAKVSLNYIIGSYDQNDSIRYFYVNDWQQKISLGLSYEI